MASPARRQQSGKTRSPKASKARSPKASKARPSRASKARPAKASKARPAKTSKARSSQTSSTRSKKAAKEKKGVTKRTAKKVAPKKKVSTKKRTAKTTAAKKTAGKKTSAKTRSSRTPSRKKLAKEMLIHSYHEMFRSRAVDEKIIVLYKQNKCHFQIGCAGHEAVQVATAQAFRPGRDWFYPYYRDMALCATLGMPNADFMLNALNKDDDPNSHGRQMPMHWGSKELRIVNQSSPTGTQFLQAVGCALAIRKLGLEEVVYVSAGEGTCSQGDFHEALNWAAREKLPVVFLIQNNKYAISVPVSEQLAGESVFKIAHGYENLELHSIDGTDLEESFHTAAAAHSRALRGDGPSLIEAHVPRLQSHSISDNHLKYRTDEDLEAERAQDPNAILRHRLLKQKLLSEDELTELEQRIRREIDEAAEFAETQPDPDPAQVESHTYSEEPRDPFASDQTEQEPERRKTGSEEDEVYLVDALNHALDEELSRDESVYLFGQDVAHGKGGVFTVTSGLTEKHGRERVFNGPLAESSIVGVGVGMATLGLKPVVEIQFGDYIWTAMMQIRNEVAMLRYRSKGDFSCPLVIRVPVGGYIHGAAYHSQNIEATFAHFPGLRIVHPSNATDAKGLLKSAIRSDDPVLFLEHKGLYRQVYAKGAEGGADALTPIGKAAIAREGSDLTIVTYGALVQKALLTAEHLEKEDGVSVEVIDLRTIAPLDTETIFASVRKTNRVLIAHEDVVFMGFGAEVTSQIATHCFEHLDAPPHRVGMKSVAAVPHAPSSESVVLPQTDDLVVASRRVLQF